MSARPLLLKGARLLDPAQGIDRQGDLLVVAGRIAWLTGAEAEPARPEGCETIEATGQVLAPGFVDLHCHLREPGDEHKETIATGSAAAAASGFTTICCMPNTSPPLDTRATVDLVLAQAKAKAPIRVLPIGCVTRGRAGKELADLGELAEAGAVGFSDDGSPVADANLMRQALSYNLSLGLPVIDHCEDPALSHGCSMNEGPVSYRLGLKGAPAAAEEAIVARDIALAELTGGRVHIAHLSTVGAAELVRRAKARGVRVTAEVTPHHLALTDLLVAGAGEDGRVPALTARSYNTNAKVNPPLRAQADCLALRQALRDGVIDCIATDHAPHAIVDKQCEFDQAAFGISGFETALGLLLRLVHAGDLTLPQVIATLTAGPAGVIGQGYHGLTMGAPAELALFDPDLEWQVDATKLLSLGKNTPIDGWTLRGKVTATIFNGTLAYRDPSLADRPDQGGRAKSQAGRKST